MRTSILALAFLLSAVAIPAAIDGATVTAMALQEQPAPPPAQPSGDPPAQPANPPSIDIDIEREGGSAWYVDPVWLAIGGIGLAVLVMLIVMASRGGGTTVVHD
jgi:hypothetical protein